MVDILKHIEYWRRGAVDALDTAEKLIAQEKTQHGLFFTHLAMEKALKAHVCKTTGDLAPYIHNLTLLAEKAKLPLNSQQNDVLSDVNDFNIEGRYPEMLGEPPSVEEGAVAFAKAKDIFQWLIQQL